MAVSTSAPFQNLDSLRARATGARVGKDGETLLTGVHDNILVKMRRHGLELEKIEADPHLSADGKRDKIKQHAMKFAEEYQSVSRVQKRETEAKDALHRMLFAPSVRRDGIDGLYDLMTDQEIRAHYATKSRAKRDSAYSAALERGDTALVRALTTGPAGSLVDKDYQQRAMTEHVEKTRPAEMARLRELEETVAHLAALRGTVGIWLKSLGADTAVLELS